MTTMVKINKSEISKLSVELKQHFESIPGMTILSAEQVSRSLRIVDAISIQSPIDVVYSHIRMCDVSNFKNVGFERGSSNVIVAKVHCGVRPISAWSEDYD